MKATEQYFRGTVYVLILYKIEFGIFLNFEFIVSPFGVEGFISIRFRKLERWMLIIRLLLNDLICLTLSQIVLDNWKDFNL